MVRSKKHLEKVELLRVTLEEEANAELDPESSETPQEADVEERLDSEASGSEAQTFDEQVLPMGAGVLGQASVGIALEEGTKLSSDLYLRTRTPFLFLMKYGSGRL